MQPLFDAQGNRLYLYAIAGYEECTWAVSPTKYTEVELTEKLIQALEKWFPIIDALNQESLELFGMEWHPADDLHATCLLPDNLPKGTVEQYDVFFDKWVTTVPFDPLAKALTDIGCEILESEASVFCSHCCLTAYQCVNLLKDNLKKSKEKALFEVVADTVF